ncbi:TetR family transcriptional regulator [Saccharopolyspora taberi]|uniref:TetR/AcrR family transcriptional regulator n=1 Tax=Saccharopolyspora taberi TaxID=60895 RepID=A0ABN3V6S4_9PSEU
MPDNPRRKHDSAASKEALLRAAAELFAERGFEQTTVREVAARAGVNQALLFRYFGSKQELFAEVLGIGSDSVLEESPADLPRRLVTEVLSLRQTGGDHPFAVMLRSFNDERAARLLRERVGERYIAKLCELTDAPDAELRAGLVLACVLGLGLSRSVLHNEALAAADPEAISAHMMRVVAALMEG